MPTKNGTRKTEWHRVVAWNGLGEYAASKLRKGDHIYVEGTLVSSTYNKDFGKGKNTVTVSLRSWQVKADSIRKLNRATQGSSDRLHARRCATRGGSLLN